jgi:PEP-CTERM motif
MSPKRWRISIQVGRSRGPPAYWAGTYSGPTDAATLIAATSFDTSGILNPIAGTFGWSIDPAGQTLSLVFTPITVPEPGTLGLVALGLLGAWHACRRGRTTPAWIRFETSRRNGEEKGVVCRL